MPKISDDPKSPPRIASKRLTEQTTPTNSQSASRARRTARVVKSEGRTDGSDASDESSDDAPQQDPTTPTPWHRPSGKDAAAYAGWEAWKPRRWAWEFLRRNKKFQSACDDEADDRPIIANDFRLREFKDYRQDYAVGEKPRFAAGIHSFPTRAEFVKHIESNATLIEEKIDRLPTEVLIRFQIAPTVAAEKTVLDHQLGQARRRLEAFADRLREMQPVDGKGKSRTVHAYDPARLLAALCILDREKTNPKFNRRAAADDLLPDAYEGSHRSKTLRQRSNSGAELLEGAGKLAEYGYLQIRSGKLKGSK